MRKLIWLLFIASCFAQTGPHRKIFTAVAAPALIQHTSCKTASSSTTCSFSGGATATHSIGIIVQSDHVPCSASSTPSNTWILEATSAIESGYTSMLAANNVASGTNSIVVSCPSATLVGASAFEISNVNTVDVLGILASAANTAVSIPTNGAVGAATEYVMAGAVDWNNYNTWTHGTGYTIEEQNYQNDSTGTYTGAYEDINTKTGLSGVQTATMTKSVNAGFTGGIMTFSNSPAQGNANTFVDFEGLSNTVAPTAATMYASTHGILPSYAGWSITNPHTALTGSTSAQSPCTYFTSIQLGATLYTGSGSLGLLDTTSTAGGDFVSYPIAIPQSTVSIGYCVQFSIPQNDSAANAYSLVEIVKQGGADYVDTVVQPNGTSLNFGFEVAGEGHTGSIAAATNTPYWITNLYVENGTHKMAVYNGTTGAQVGSTISVTDNGSSSLADTIQIGVTGSESSTAGKTIYFDNVEISFAGTFPLGP